MCIHAEVPTSNHFSLAPLTQGQQLSPICTVLVTKQHVPRAIPIRNNYACGHKMMANFVKKKSAIKIAIEITTTVRVVLFPTPAVPPFVVMPK